MVSCVGDNDTSTIVYNPLTPTEKATQINAMAGLYHGKVYLFDTTGGNPVDSAVINFTVGTDSSLVINELPLKFFTRKSGNVDFNNSIGDQTSTLRGNVILYAPYGYDYDRTNFYFFAFWPRENTSTTWTANVPYNVSGQDQNMGVTFSSTYAAGLPNSIDNLNMYVASTNGTPVRGLNLFLAPQTIKAGNGSTYTVTDLLLITGYH